MRIILVIFGLMPCVLHAQLDRIRTNMTEQEFIKSIPEAKRDYDAEAYWVSMPDTFEVPGNSLWRIYRDTAAYYRFNSVSIHGPSSQYPEADSGAVHELRVFLEGYYKELEYVFGKPTRIVNIPFDSVGRNFQSAAYLVQWNFGIDDYVRISLSTDLSTGNFINAPGKFTVIEAASYELRIDITHRSDLMNEIFDLGESSDVFFRINPIIKQPIGAGNKHQYQVLDSLTASNAYWQFTFIEGKMHSFHYRVYAGTGYGSQSDALAYEKLKIRSESLLKEGTASFGKPDSVSNNMTVNHKSHGLNLVYQVIYLHCDWVTPAGKVVMDFMEMGGGKNPDIVFTVRVDFERKN